MVPQKALAFNVNTGRVGNTVCFVRFADEDADVFERPLSFYEELFNTSESSVRSYFTVASYNQLTWESQFVASDGKIASYQAQHERGYYYPYDASVYPNGYADATDAAAREQALVREIATWLSANKPAGVDFDVNADGFVDNLCIVVSGGSGISARYALWPHRSDLALPDEKAIYIDGKKLVGYLMVFDGANGYDGSWSGITLSTGVLCHEMSHSLGTFDLYHSEHSLNPVGVWDLMSDNQREAQQMTAYTKMRYCKWIDSIPQLTASGRYSLRPMAEGNGPVAYKIQPKGRNEYFVVEYRPKTGFDKNLPAGGLIVYRVNPDYSRGNLGYNGTTRFDEIYVFRPGGSTTADGNISAAAMAEGNTYSSMAGEGTLGTPFYQDGTVAPFSITEVSAPGDSISFTLTLGQLPEKPAEDNPTDSVPANALFYDGFEHPDSNNGWTISSLGDRGWRWQQKTNYYKTFEGDYSATVYSAWDDIHQDEYLTSPRLSNAALLTFQSRSTACGAHPRNPQYYLVEVSSDGGSSWTTILNLSDDLPSTASGKYTEVSLDLTPYMSDNMYVRFHCYDTDNAGLSYYWSIDNVCFMPLINSIRTVSTDDESAPVYTVGGVRVAGDNARGIYIRNGRKYVK